jgi:hypothetical protein
VLEQLERPKRPENVILLILLIVKYIIGCKKNKDKSYSGI